VWILFLNVDGTVKSELEVTDGIGGFEGALDTEDAFGASLAALGDLNNDGVADLAVGAPYDDDGGTNRGAIWNLFLASDGTVISTQKISETEGSFSGSLDNYETLSRSLAATGDLDGDDVTDLAVGGFRGAVRIFFLNEDGTMKAFQRIACGEGDFEGAPGLGFGVSLAFFEDLDGDGAGDLGVLESGTEIWVLFLESPFSGVQFLRGDVDGDGNTQIQLLDALYLLKWAFTEGPEPPCMDAADVDGDNNVSIQLLDALYLLEWAFTGGAPPPFPGPSVCGPDPDGAEDGIDCVEPSVGCE
jgi:hypothetical protein